MALAMNMQRATYNLLIEPSGRRYSDLLDYAIKECKYFLLVTDRENKQLSPKGKGVLEELLPHLCRMEMKSEWPGTVLYGSTVPVYLYHFIPESAAILKQSASRLYQWQRPDLPDDLCLLRSDESPWLATIAHENDGYFVMNEEEWRRFSNAIPTFTSMVKVANG